MPSTAGPCRTPPYGPAPDGRDVAVLFPAWRGGGMPLARGLYGTFPAFRREFDTVCRALDELLPLPLSAVVFAQRGGVDAWLLHTPRYGRPALFAYQLALFRLWREWALPVGAVSGEGTGAVGAAHAAGLLELGTAARHVVGEDPKAACGGGEPALTGFPVLLRCAPGAGDALVGVGRSAALLDALADLQVRGTPLDWAALRACAADRQEPGSGTDRGALEPTGVNLRAPLP